jgi:hypothetical protein
VIDNEKVFEILNAARSTVVRRRNIMVHRSDEVKIDASKPRKYPHNLKQDLHINLPSKVSRSMFVLVTPGMSLEVCTFE